MSSAPRYWAVVPAAGVGKRMGAEIPKQYLPLQDKAILQHTLERLLVLDCLERVVVAISNDDGFWSGLAAASDPRVMAVAGGRERADSVLAGLRALEGTAGAEDWVLVHDAARPCLPPKDVFALLAQVADDSVGGILALPCHDTLKLVEAGRISQTLDRSRVWRALTPQMFRYRLLSDALQKALSQGLVVTDEASAVEALGRQPLIVEGNACNIKITRPEDLSLAAFYLEHD